MRQASAKKKRKTRATSSTSSVESCEQSSPNSSADMSRMPDSKKSKQDTAKKGQTTLSDTFSVKTIETAQTKSSLETKIDTICESMVTEESLKGHMQSLITTDQLNSALSQLKTDLLKEVNTMIDAKLEHLQGQIHDLSVDNTNLKETVQNLTKKIDSQKFQAQAALNTAKSLEIKVNDLEQYGRKSNVRIFGLNDVKKDETAQETAVEVVRMLTSQLKMDVNVNDIDIAHRLGRYEIGKPRAVIVKFMRRRHKMETIQKRRALKGTRVVIREDLTPLNQKLLREVITTDNVENAWTKDGVIFAIHSITRNIVKVTHFDDIATKFMNTNC
jgi:hypothetical protein